MRQADGRAKSGVILLGWIFIALGPASSQTVTEAWVRSDADGFPYGSMIALDSAENVVVTGWRAQAYIVTKKYHPNGDLVWERQFSVPDLEAVATWIVVDPSDNVVVTGYPRTLSSNPVEVGLLTLKYDSDGNLLWSDIYEGTWAFAARAVSDAEGNVYVAGRAWFGTHDFVTIKYAPDGTRLWVDTFDWNAGFHTPNAMDLDGEGHLVINGGGLSGGLITVLYDGEGTRQWVVERSGTPGSSVRLTQDGHFFVTGGLFDPVTSDDILLQKYDLDGNLVWERTYDFGGSERGLKLGLDSQGNVVITGTQSINWITIKVDPQGALLWSNVYDTPTGWDEYASFLTVGPSDEVYMTGTGGPCPPAGCSFRSMVTLRYNADGSNPWVALYWPTSARGVGLALASDGSLYAAGDWMLTVIKYAQSGGEIFSDGFESGDTSAWSLTVP